MDVVKPSHSFRRPLILILALVALLLTGCGVSASGNFPGISAENDRVYIAYSTSVYAVDVAQQRELWRYPAEGGSTEYFAAPSVNEGRIVLGDAGAKQGFLSPGVIASAHAINDVDSGSPTAIWTSSDSDPVARDRIVAPALQANGQVFVGTADNALVALDGNSGSEQWRFELGHSVWGQPAFADGAVITGSLDKSVYALDANTGSLKWQTTLGGAISSGIVIDNGVAYVGSFDGNLYALDVNSGDELFAAAATDWVWSAPSIANGNVHFADASGLVLAVDQNNGSEIWRTNVDGVVEAGVLAQDDTVYVPVAVPIDTTKQTGKLVAINADTGTIRWQIEKDQPLFVTPVSAANQIVVGYIGEDNEVILNVFDADGKQVWTYTPAE